MNHLMFAPGDMEKNARRCIVTLDASHVRLIVEGLIARESALLQFGSVLRVVSVGEDMALCFMEGREPGVTTIEFVDADSWAEENTVAIPSDSKEADANAPVCPACGNALRQGDGDPLPPMYCDPCGLGWMPAELFEHGRQHNEAEVEAEDDHINFPCGCIPNQAGCMQPGCRGEWS